MTLDRIDKKIIAALAQDARATHVQLSEIIGLTPTAIARRLKALEDAKILVGYHADLGLKRLGFTTIVITRITLEIQNKSALAAFEKAIAKCPSVVRCFLMSGSNVDYLLTIVARDIEDFEAIHKTQLSRLPGVARIDSSFALREVINRNFPPAALEF